MVIIDKNIPGWNGEEILIKIAEYAMSVNKDGNILELGALFGRTTYALGKNKDSSVKLFAVDCWPEIRFSDHEIVDFHDNTCNHENINILEQFVIDNPKRIDSYKAWKYWTKDISNIENIRNLTLNIDETKFPDFELIIHDAAHDYDNVYKDLVKWFPKLKKDGIMIIDDYEPQFAGLMMAVDKYVSENDLETQMVTGRNILLRRKQ
jgi:predicted O-methyltransferase YrrM